MQYSNKKNERAQNNFKKVLFSTNTSKYFFILKFKEKSTYQMRINFAINLNKIYKLSMFLILRKCIV